MFKHRQALVSRCAPVRVLSHRTQGTAAQAAPVIIAKCSPHTGVSVSSETKDRLPGGYDPEAKAYVSHPLNGESATTTVNSDGTASAASFLDGGSSIATNMHVLGKDGNQY